MLKIVSTTPYSDQKMGTAGLRRKSKVVIQPNYIENFLQSIFNTIGDLSGHTYIVGGDGRFYNDVAIQKFIKMAAANGIHKLIIGQNGLLSTPASSNLILKIKQMEDLYLVPPTTLAEKMVTLVSNMPPPVAGKLQVH